MNNGVGVRCRMRHPPPERRIGDAISTGAGLPEQVGQQPPPPPPPSPLVMCLLRCSGGGTSIHRARRMEGWNVYVLPILAWPGSLTRPTKKIASAMTKLAMAMARASNSFDHDIFAAPPSNGGGGY